METFPEPPALEPDAVAALVGYARDVVAHLEAERREAAARGLDAPELPGLVEGWTFVATALAESYDRLDLLPE
ncbi:hypothetical protein [Vallicoccus soli]|uniref:Uncharacterized protein n=1 Tax=Vallicoccus soli TaxID=2339232 RepID=A0A3A3YVF8_9ACTN|nr:hypothetical protein [Vallicoccus soli]RJK94749.1 hypothetical protein D5H78_12995 [Vallicoccus soli]